MKTLTNIAWDKLELIVFDVDGTLYNQNKLRRRVLISLLTYYSIRPWKYKELLVLYHFRKEREKHSGRVFNCLEEEQYTWCSIKMGIPVSVVKDIIDKWIFNYPNKFILSCMYPGAREFLKIIKDRKILSAVYSDYPSEKKVKAMGLTFDLLVSSSDSCINAMKPYPKGLNHIINELNIRNHSNCLFIGDRQELDGRCADLANIPFMLLKGDQAEDGFYLKLAKALSNSGTKNA